MKKSQTHQMVFLLLHYYKLWVDKNKTMDIDITFVLFQMEYTQRTGSLTKTKKKLWGTYLTTKLLLAISCVIAW